MTDSTKGLTRSKFVQGTIVLPALAGMLVAAGTLSAEAKGTKAQFKYQTSPKNGQHCSQCTFFVASTSLASPGLCKIVSGPISPNGWCTAFHAKSS